MSWLGARKPLGSAGVLRERIALGLCPRWAREVLGGWYRGISSKDMAQWSVDPWKKQVWALTGFLLWPGIVEQVNLSLPALLRLSIWDEGFIGGLASCLVLPGSSWMERPFLPSNTHRITNSKSWLQQASLSPPRRIKGSILTGSLLGTAYYYGIRF